MNQPISKKRVQFVRPVKAVGNGTMVSLHKKELDALGIEAGADVRVTVEPVTDSYEATSEAVDWVFGRYSKTLDLLGK